MRIFVAPASLVEGELQIRGDEHHYLARVRRAVVGDHIELVDGAGRRAPAKIVAITDTATTLQVFAVTAIPLPRPLIRILLPLIKGERMDFALEKLVEVGADAIVVWPAAHGVVKLDVDRRASRIEKFQLALQAAARQSGCALVPTIAWADSLATAIADLEGAKLVLDPNSDAPLATALANEPQVTIASGPEGGLSPAELAQFHLAGFAPVGLGPRVLRAETAPVAATAIIRALTRS